MNILYFTGKQSRLILNNDWVVSYFNKNVSETFSSFYPKNLNGKFTLRDYIDKPLLSFFSENFQSALDGEEVHRKKMVEIEGKEYWFEFSFFPLWDTSKKVNQVLYVSEDVTENFLNEKKILRLEKERLTRENYLKKSEEKWRSLVESSPNIIFTLDKELNFTYINYLLSNLKIQDVIGTNYLQYIPKEDIPRISKYLNDCIHKGMVREFEIRGTIKGSLTPWYSVRIAPIRNNQTEEIEAIIAVSSEITEKKIIENQILESEEKFRAMADNAPVLIWISGKDSLCNFFNKPWLEFTGKTMEEEVGTGWTEGIHLDDLDYCLKTYMDSFLRKQGFEMEYRLKRFDGEYRWLLDRGIPFITSSGEFSGFIGSCIDITERKQFESKIKTSLEEKEILLKEIHHRVKNNLQIISSLLSLQSNQFDNKEISEIFQTNINRVKSIALLHDMLNLSLDQSQINFKDYLKLITNYLAIIHETTLKKTQMILEAEDIIVTIDIAIYLGLIVNELVSNSLKYAFPESKSGEIRINASWKSDMIFLCVKDNGIGLPASLDLQKVKTLGLKLVSMLTKQLNGNLLVEKESGLVFQIVIPIDPQKNRGK